MLKTKVIYFLLIIIIFLSSSALNSQTKSRKQLEKQRSQIKKEIKEINNLLFSNTKKKAAAYSDIENLNIKIQRKEELVNITFQEINLLSLDIEKNSFKLDSLEQELFQVKEAYKKMILKSYKTKSGKSRIMFLLSSNSFFQAYKRIQYMKQYARYRKKQAQKINSIVVQIEDFINELNTQKLNKKTLLKNNNEVKKSLEQEKVRSNQLVYQLRRKEKRYKNQISQKQKKSLAIDNEIKRLIKEAIAKSNNKKTNSFALTPEARELEKNFILNKGKLPWPVVKGVVIQKFGTQPHPVVKTAKIKSNGIVIATPQNEKVRTIFDGEILSVLQFRGSNPTILIQHGNYITAYKNLSKVYVKKGDKVFSNQNIGEVFTNNSSGRSTIQFSIFQKTTAVNPLAWIIKM
ncbi:MAG: murein hydrolase activator EnvC family protein [Flavobacteriaceae bacterium]